jgi:hypothetical protein
MLRISTETKMKPAEVIKAAAKYFTEQYGLKVKEQDEDSIELEGGGGGVALGVKTVEKKTQVEVVTNEWEIQVKDFMGWLKGK